jgi:hypothetical protein
MVALLTGVVPLRTWPWKATEVTVTEKVAEALLPAESVTWTVTGMEVSPVAGVPVITPLGESVRPTALRPVPEVTAQV